MKSFPFVCSAAGTTPERLFNEPELSNARLIQLMQLETKDELCATLLMQVLEELRRQGDLLATLVMYLHEMRDTVVKE